MARQSTYYRILEYVHEQVQALDLEGIPATQVYRRKLATDRNTTLPACIVAMPANAVPSYEYASNEREDVGFPVLVVFLKASNQDLDLDAVAMAWQETAMSKCRDIFRIPQTFVWNNRIEPLPVLDSDLFLDKNLDVGGFTVRFLSREPRG